jgi:hypothetical protein
MVECFHEWTPLIGGNPRVRSLFTGKQDRHIARVRRLEEPCDSPGANSAVKVIHMSQLLETSRSPDQ